MLWITHIQEKNKGGYMKKCIGECGKKGCFRCSCVSECVKKRKELLSAKENKSNSKDNKG